jgi:hypothetical protein
VLSLLRVVCVLASFYDALAALVNITDESGARLTRAREATERGVHKWILPKSASVFERRHLPREFGTPK